MVERKIPTGYIMKFEIGKCPDGYLVCDGTAVSRKKYPDLFKAVGTTYGEGDGSKTFNLPNFQDVTDNYIIKY